MNHHKSSIQRKKKKRQHQRQNEEIAICGGPNRNPPGGNRSGAEYNQNRGPNLEATLVVGQSSAMPETTIC